MVRVAILSPLLELAGFYDPPFYATSEKSVNISAQDHNLTIRGKIDILVTQDQFWILVIESKQSGIAIDSGIPHPHLHARCPRPHQIPLRYGHEWQQLHLYQTPRSHLSTIRRVLSP